MIGFIYPYRLLPIISILSLVFLHFGCGKKVEVKSPGVKMVECWFEEQRKDGNPSRAYFVDIVRLE